MVKPPATRERLAGGEVGVHLPLRWAAVVDDRRGHAGRRTGRWPCRSRRGRSAGWPSARPPTPTTPGPRRRDGALPRVSPSTSSTVSQPSTMAGSPSSWSATAVALRSARAWATSAVGPVTSSSSAPAHDHLGREARPRAARGRRAGEAEASTRRRVTPPGWSTGGGVVRCGRLERDRARRRRRRTAGWTFDRVTQRRDASSDDPDGLPIEPDRAQRSWPRATTAPTPPADAGGRTAVSKVASPDDEQQQRPLPWRSGGRARRGRAADEPRASAGTPLRTSGSSDVELLGDGRSGSPR